MLDEVKVYLGEHPKAEVTRAHGAARPPGPGLGLPVGQNHGTQDSTATAHSPVCADLPLRRNSILG